MKGKSSDIKGTTDRPRLRVTVTLGHIYAQVIDDTIQKTLVAASTMDKELKKELKSNIESASVVGKMIGERAVKKGLKKIVFDRGPKRYHGKVKAVADAARKQGLEF